MSDRPEQRRRSPLKRKTVSTYMSEAALARIDELVLRGDFVSRSHAFDEALRLFLAVRGISLNPIPNEEAA